MFYSQGIPDLCCGGPAMSTTAEYYWSNNQDQYLVTPQYRPLIPESTRPAWRLPSSRNDMRPLWQINGTRSDIRKAKAIVKRKRQRTVFTPHQIGILEEMYKLNQYPTREDRNAISEKLKLSDKPVETWFRNRRLKKRKETHQHMEEVQQEEGCGESDMENVGVEDISVIYTSPIYEPVSPASVSESNEDDNISSWESPDPYESLYYLFDLQTMFAL